MHPLACPSNASPRMPWCSSHIARWIEIHQGDARMHALCVPATIKGTVAGNSHTPPRGPYGGISAVQPETVHHLLAHINFGLSRLVG